jgi:CHAD domain-containing protein
VPSIALKRSPERELKLEPGPEFELGALDGEAHESRVFTSVYHDASDRSLGRLGITLLRRTENGRSVWRLQLPGEDGRLEIEADGPPAGPPPQIAGLLRAPLLGRKLEPVAVLHTRRRVVVIRGPADTVAEVGLDEVQVMDGRRVTGSFSELGIEVVAGGDDGLRKLGKRVAKAGAEPTNGQPKVLQKLLAVDSSVPPPGKDASFADHLGRMLRRQLDEIRVHDPGVRLGDDPEELHDLRVAVRRLRAVLRAARSALPDDWTGPLRGELKWLGSDVLGPHRDLDVLLERLREQAVALGPEDEEAAEWALAALERDRAEAREALLEALDGERYPALLLALDRSVDLPPVIAEVSPAQIAAGEFAKLEKLLDKIGAESSDEDLHRLRIGAKKARYAAELAEPTVGKRARRFVESAKHMQDVIGTHQDAIVAEERLRSLLGRTRSKGPAFALGRLVERERTRRAEARLAVPSASAEVARRGRRAWA